MRHDDNYTGPGYSQPVQQYRAPVEPGGAPIDYPQHVTSIEVPKKKKRVFMWVILAINLLFLVWVVGGAAQASGTPTDCGSLNATDCNSASDAGTAIGVVLVVMLWAFVDIVLGVVYMVTRRK